MSSSEDGMAIRLAEIVFPHHCNHLGTLFGGQALAWMDKAAFLVSSRYSGGTTVTARSEEVDFKAPIRLGDTVEIVASIRKVARSSMTVNVALLRVGRCGHGRDRRRIRDGGRGWRWPAVTAGDDETCIRLDLLVRFQDVFA